MYDFSSLRIIQSTTYIVSTLIFIVFLCVEGLLSYWFLPQSFFYSFTLGKGHWESENALHIQLIRRLLICSCWEKREESFISAYLYQSKWQDCINQIWLVQSIKIFKVSSFNLNWWPLIVVHFYKKFLQMTV